MNMNENICPSCIHRKNMGPFKVCEIVGRPNTARYDEECEFYKPQSNNYRLPLTHLVTHEMRWEKLKLYIISCEEGTITFELNDEPQGPCGVKAFISNFWVKEEYRRRGVGKQLLDVVEQLCPISDIFLEWHWADTPVWVKEWYERNGYKEIAFGNQKSLMKKEL